MSPWLWILLVVIVVVALVQLAIIAERRAAAEREVHQKQLDLALLVARRKAKEDAILAQEAAARQAIIDDETRRQAWATYESQPSLLGFGESIVCTLTGRTPIHHVSHIKQRDYALSHVTQHRPLLELAHVAWQGFAKIQSEGGRSGGGGRG
jgi:hypothetical protein